MRAIVLAMTILLGCVGGWPSQASAQEPPRDFFSLLFGGFQQRQQQPQRRYEEPPRQRITITPRVTSRSGSLTPSDSTAPTSRRARTASRSDGGDEDSGATRRGTRSSGWGSPVTYCVRTCDGRYFPLNGQSDGASDPNAVAQCSAFCPATATEVFYTSSGDKGIDGAVNKSGRSYSASPNAFVFRERLVAGCSCTGQGTPLGVHHLDILDDPTLRKGDIVMTTDGARIFRGGKRKPPFRGDDFVTPSRFPDLSGDMRKRLNELTVASR